MDEPSTELRFAVWLQSDGQCECRSRECDHHKKGERCPVLLEEDENGSNWKAHKIDPNKGYSVLNCVALCDLCQPNKSYRVVA